jgi:hypothetical protein
MKELTKEQLIEEINTPKKVFSTVVRSVLVSILFVAVCSGLMVAHPSIIVNNTSDSVIAVDVMTAVGAVWKDPVLLMIIFLFSTLMLVAFKARKNMAKDLDI